MAEPPDGCDLVLLRNIPLMTRIARGLARGDGWPGQTAGQGRRLARGDGWPGETAGQGRRLARGDGWPGETAGQGRRLARGDGRTVRNRDCSTGLPAAMGAAITVCHREPAGRNAVPSPVTTKPSR